MALSERSPLRVTIGDAVRDLDPDASGAFEPTGPGRGILRTAAGPRRVLWAIRRQRSAGDQGGLRGGDPTNGSGAGLELEIVVDGWRFEATVEPAARAALRDRARRGAAAVRAHAALVIRAPIPGRIGSVTVVDGQAVEAGEALLTLEAMKMENVVRSPRAGTIGRIAVGAGQTVELGDTLVELV